MILRFTLLPAAEDGELCPGDLALDADCIYSMVQMDVNPRFGPCVAVSIYGGMRFAVVDPNQDAMRRWAAAKGDMMEDV